MNKTCTNCKVEKSLEQFYGNPRTRDRKTSHCKSCIKLATRARYRRKQKNKPPKPDRDEANPEIDGHRDYYSHVQNTLQESFPIVPRHFLLELPAFVVDGILESERKTGVNPKEAYAQG